MSRSAIAAAALVGFAVTVAAQRSPLDYPQWRGQDRDGAASALVAPKTWPEKLTRRWKASVGEGYATPLVIGKTVYIFTRRDDREVMTALDADTGAERWRSSYAAPYSPSSPAAAHGAGPKATPLFHNGRLYTLGIGGIATAFDAAGGAIRWQTPAPAEPPYYSAASSPATDARLIFFHPGNYGPLTAFDAESGDVKWKAGGDGLYASPIVVTIGGSRQVVSVLQENVIGVSPTGEILWQYPWRGLGGSTTPILHHDTIIISGLDMGVRAIRPIQRGARWEVETVWETREVSMFLSNPVVIGETLFGLSHRASGQFFALDAGTGKVLWLGPPREATNAAIVKAGDLLFLLEDSGELIVARASRTGFEPIRRYTVADSATWAQPAVSGRRIFVKDVSTVALWTLN